MLSETALVAHLKNGSEEIMHSTKDQEKITDKKQYH